ncbi:hypothetical protein AB0271_08360 [Kocuria palustris]|uniref:hypothetical protein n=1 Tax=Kocuria palustris TaxID=71999 RepID=UPI00344FA22E
MAVDAQGRKVRRHSGEGTGAVSLILLIGAMATILVSFYLFAFHENWLFLLGIVVYGAALLVPTGIMASKTRSRPVGGHETALDLPASAATNISKPAGH